MLRTAGEVMIKFCITAHIRTIITRYFADNERQAGFGLVESLVAVAILGTTVFMLLGSLSTGSISVGILQERTTAENLARSQLEYTMSLPYLPAPYSYQIVDYVPSGYSVTAESSAVSGRDINIQKITVTVYREGKRLYSIEGFKVNRGGGRIISMEEREIFR